PCIIWCSVCEITRQIHRFRFLDLGLVQPGLICSKVRRQRVSFSWMDSTVAVHTKGLESCFQAVRNASMEACRSATLRKTPRRMALLSRWPNHLSTRFIQLELVGTKCGTNRGWRFSHASTFACLCVP